MTSPVCPGGTQAKPGVVGTIIVAGALFEAWLASRSRWLAPFIPFISPFVFDPSSVCDGDPEPFPDFTDTDLVALIKGEPIAKLGQLLNHLAWWEYCECVGSVTPAPPLISPPAGLPLVPPGSNEACDQLHGLYRANDHLESLDIPIIGTFANPAWLVQGATSFTARSQITVRPVSGGSSNRNVFNIGFWSAAGVGLPPSFVLNTDPAVDQGVVTIPYTALPAGTARVTVTQTCQPGGTCQPGREAIIDLTFQCGTDPNRIQPECCPPDPTLIGKLDRLLLQMALVVARLGPTEPLQVISTTSVSGEGQMPLAQGTRMLDVQLTTLGPDVQIVPYANPDRIRRAATIRFGNDFGWQRRQSVDAQDNLFPVPLDSQVVSWSISPGTSGTLVQLGQLL